jgi:dipeptide transport system ATP-binding protein
VRPELQPWQDGLVRCHYPLGDPERDANIARDCAVALVTQ